MSADDLLVEREAGVVTLTLNRPHKLNALTKPLWRNLGEAVTRLDADDSVRCIVLRGAGEKAFSPGNDISEFETERSNIEQARVYGALMHGTLHALADCRHPLVAMIHGICVGGGMEIACLCDLRICGEGSRFGAPVSRLASDGPAWPAPRMMASKRLIAARPRSAARPQPPPRLPGRPPDDRDRTRPRPAPAGHGRRASR